MRRLELDIFYVATRAALLLLLPLYLSDLGLYEEYAHNLLRGGLLPYRDFPLEYPPLAYPLMLLPSFLHDLFGFTSPESYRLFFGAFLLPFDFLLYFRFRNFAKMGGAALLYVLFTTAMGQLIFDRFDIVLGFLLAWPFMGKKNANDLKYSLSWGLGAALKLVPLCLVPLCLVPLAPMQWLDEKTETKLKAKRFAKFALVAGLPIFLSCLGAALLGGGKISFLSHHANRGVQIESLIASLLFFAKSYFQLGQVSVDTNFGAQHLAGAASAVLASRVLFWGMLLYTYVLLFWDRARWDILSASWLVISGFVTFGYVLSPQFILWLIPIGICAAPEVPPGKKRMLWLAIFGLAIVGTCVHFRNYWDYVGMKHFATAIVLLRNLLLAGLWVLSWKWMGRTVLSPAKS